VFFTGSTSSRRYGGERGGKVRQDCRDRRTARCERRRTVGETRVLRVGRTKRPEDAPTRPRHLRVVRPLRGRCPHQDLGNMPRDSERSDPEKPPAAVGFTPASEVRASSGSIPAGGTATKASGAVPLSSVVSAKASGAIPLSLVGSPTAPGSASGSPTISDVLAGIAATTVVSPTSACSWPLRSGAVSTTHSDTPVSRPPPISAEGGVSASRSDPGFITPIAAGSASCSTPGGWSGFPPASIRSASATDGASRGDVPSSSEGTSGVSAST
jgi:hypothetical protein